MDYGKQGSFKTKKQMAQEYSICTKTFGNLLKLHKITIHRRLISPKEQEEIYRVLGLPKNSQKGA